MNTMGKSLLQIVEETTMCLLSHLASIDNLHRHEIKDMEKFNNHEYLLDVQQDPSIFHSARRRVSARGGS